MSDRVSVNRRGLFGFLAGAAAVVALPKLPIPGASAWFLQDPPALVPVAIEAFDHHPRNLWPGIKAYWAREYDNNPVLSEYLFDTT
jgi:hypothetical protein